MKKFIVFVLALSVLFGIGSGASFADVQIDKGRTRGDKSFKYFIARNARPTAISADRVVVFDSNSADGVSVTTTTTSADHLVAGITIDAIPGITSDATAANSAGTPNWGRVKTWGYHENVVTAISSISAGEALITSSTAGAASTNHGNTVAGLSQDLTAVGVALNSGSSNTVDAFIRID